jgi:hypothetical protein
MSKRNLTILIIVVAVILAFTAFGLIYFANPVNKGEATTGTNFLSNLFPSFGGSKTTGGGNTAPANISGYIPGSVVNQGQLVKVSSMPIAGFGIFTEQRYSDVTATPAPISTTATTATTPASSVTTTPATTTKSPQGKQATTKTPTAAPTPPTTESVPAVRYVEKATGNIYQTFADKIDEQKVTTTMIPLVYEASFADNANSVIMRYLKDDERTVESFIGTVPQEILGGDTTGASTLNGSFLPDGITDMSISPDGSSIFYLFNSGDEAMGVTANPLGEQKVQIFDSPFTEWLSSWPNNQMITLTTKPSANVPGYMYAINPNMKDFNKILGGINGLTTLTSPSGKLVLYTDNTLNLRIYHIDTGVSDLLGVRTLPEKCVWSKDSTMLYCAVPISITPGDYPDDWYQGNVSFSDQFWQIDPTSDNAEMLIDPTKIGDKEILDATRLALDDGGNYLFFQNKIDSYLWEIKLY